MPPSLACTRPGADAGLHTDADITRSQTRALFGDGSHFSKLGRAFESTRLGARAYFGEIPSRKEEAIDKRSRMVHAFPVELRLLMMGRFAVQKRPVVPCEISCRGSFTFQSV